MAVLEGAGQHIQFLRVCIARIPTEVARARHAVDAIYTCDEGRADRTAAGERSRQTGRCEKCPDELLPRLHDVEG